MDYWIEYITCTLSHVLLILDPAQYFGNTAQTFPFLNSLNQKPFVQTILIQLENIFCHPSNQDISPTKFQFRLVRSLENQCIQQMQD